MAKQPLNTLKAWFKTGSKPLQQQFWDWMDSFWHKDEKIPIDNVDTLLDALNGMANKNALQEVSNNINGHIADKNNPHAVTKEQIGLSDVDNTSDADKPVSIATQAAIDAVAIVSADRFEIDADHTYQLPAGSFADMIAIKPEFNEVITITADGEEVINAQTLTAGVWFRVSVDLVADENALPVNIAGATNDCSVIVYKRSIT